jgi:hypothetical protein
MNIIVSMTKDPLSVYDLSRIGHLLLMHAICC